jgi:hypothetical protein
MPKLAALIMPLIVTGMGCDFMTHSEPGWGYAVRGAKPVAEQEGGAWYEIPSVNGLRMRVYANSLHYSLDLEVKITNLVPDPIKIEEIKIVIQDKNSVDINYRPENKPACYAEHRDITSLNSGETCNIVARMFFTERSVSDAKIRFDLSQLAIHIKGISRVGQPVVIRIPLIQLQ